MNKIVKRVLGICLTLVIALGVIIPVSAAGSTTLALSKTSVSVGDTFTVTVKFSANEHFYSVDATLTYDSTVLQYVSGESTSGSGGVVTIYDDADGKTKSVTIKFKAIAKGNSTIKVSNCMYGNISGNDISISGASTTVNVINKSSSLSSNANLSLLKVLSGKLSPEFSPNVTSYTVNVDYSVTKVLVSAQCADKGAEYEVQGSSTMKVGKNTRTVVVTAANGTQKKYVINIYRAAENGSVPKDEEETPPAETDNRLGVTIDGTEWYLADDYANVERPNMLQIGSVSIDGKDVPALVCENTNIVYATDVDGANGKYFIYYSETDTFVECGFINGEYIITKIDTSHVLPEQFMKTNQVIEENSREVIKYIDTALEDFAIFYGINSSGEKGYYRLETSTGSVQRATDFTLALSAPASTNTADFSGISLTDWLIVGAIGIVAVMMLVLVIVLIVGLVRSRGEKRQENSGYDDEADVNNFVLPSLHGEFGYEQETEGEFEEKPLDFNFRQPQSETVKISKEQKEAVSADETQQETVGDVISEETAEAEQTAEETPDEEPSAEKEE